MRGLGLQITNGRGAHVHPQRCNASLGEQTKTGQQRGTGLHGLPESAGAKTAKYLEAPLPGHHRIPERFRDTDLVARAHPGMGSPACHWPVVCMDLGEHGESDYQLPHPDRIQAIEYPASSISVPLSGRTRDPTREQRWSIRGLDADCVGQTP